MCGRVGGRSGRSSGACQATAEKTSSELAAGLQTRRRRHFTACLKEAALRHPSSKEQVLICNITSGSLGLNVGRFTPYGQKIKTVEKTVSCPFPA